MRFYSRTLPLDFVYHEAMIRSDTSDVLLHIRVSSNDVDAWLIGLLKMMNDPVGRANCQRLVYFADQLQRCELIAAWPPTFWKVVYAFRRFLKYAESESLDGRDTAQDILLRLLSQKYDFHTIYDIQQSAYRYGLIVDGDLLLDKRYPLSSLSPEDVAWSCIPRECWTQSIVELRANDRDRLRKALEHYDILREIVLPRPSALAHQMTPVPQSDPDRDQQLQAASDPADQAESRPDNFALLSFVSFSKALVDFLDRSADFAQFRSAIPTLCAFIVEHEHDSFEERKRYLERILAADESPTTKIRRLESIVQNMRDSVRREPSDRPGRAHLAAIVGSISNYYLSQYDLDSAAHFWELLREDDWLLRGILSFYRSPQRYALAAIIALAGLHLTALLHGVVDGGALLPRVLSAGAALLIVILLAPIAVIAVYMPLRFIISLGGKPRGVEYIELFLPRLLGAIVVGLSVLLLQDTAWTIALHLEPLNLLLACLAVYSLSFVYIFIEVHSTLRLLPLLPDQHTTTIGRSVARSSSVFLIGLQEAFIAALLTSGLFANPVLRQAQIDVGKLAAQGQAMVWRIDGVGSFIFLPALVWLWIGLILLIGAFAQLIWQDRRITSPL